MNIIDFETFFKKINTSIPDEKEFIKIGDATALLFKNNNFLRMNYERGMVLYALISKYRPKHILEFGTASGYSTLCMAWALTDNDIDGKIYSIDLESPQLVKKHVIQWPNGEPHFENISTYEIWKKIAKPEWLEKIDIFTGYTGEVFEKNIFPKFDFGYIDAAHFYTGVKNDYYNFLINSSDSFGILFDDYVSREHYGVKKLIDDEIDNNFIVTLIKTDRDKNLLKMKKSNDENYGMCWLENFHSKFKKQNKIHDMKKFIHDYRKFEKRLKLRNNINKKIPLFKNIRFNIFQK